MKGAIKFVLAVVVVALLFIGYANLTQKKDAHDANSQDSWSYEEPIDKVTGEKQYQATRTVALDIGGTAKMTADCRGGEDSSRNLGIRIVFFDKEGKGID